MSVITPQQRALLNTIARAEGTWDSKGGRPRYDQTFGYTTFDPNNPHPERIVRSGGYASDAAGAYQFLSTTWKGVKGGNKPMTPENQDLGALELVRRRGVDPNKPLDAASLNKLAPEWASLPTLEGKSYYGQPVKQRDELLNFYNQQLQAASGGSAPAAIASASSNTSSPGSSGGGGGGELPPIPDSGFTIPLLGGGGSSLSPGLLGGAVTSDPGLIAMANSQQQLGSQIDQLGSSLQPRRGQRLLRDDNQETGKKRMAGQMLAGIASFFS